MYKQPTIILASTSPRRRELLGQLGLRFKVVPSDYEEDMSLTMKPLALARYLSRGKARAVAANRKKAVVIAADTFIALGTKLLGKPHTAATACKTLRAISGKTVRVITGVTVIDTDKEKELCRAVETKVFIKKLSPAEINGYVASGEPLDKAGAFGIQGLGAVIVRKLEGDYFNVMGLPLFELAKMLKELNIKII